jgi:hypothetical protein
MRRTIRYEAEMGRECAPLVALAHLEGQSRRLPPWLSRPDLGGTPPIDGGWPSSRTAIAQPPKGSELCAVPRSRMFSAWGLFCGCASHSAVILLLPADAIRILVRLRMVSASFRFADRSAASLAELGTGTGRRYSGCRPLLCRTILSRRG